MRILWIKADRLLPVHNGGNIRSYHIARHLGNRHELTFFSYYPGKPDAEYEQALAAELPGAVGFCTGTASATPMARALDYALRLPAKAPYAVSRFGRPAVQQRIQEWFRQSRFEVAICDFLDAAVNFPAELSIPSVLFQHNVESEIWRRHSETEQNPAKRAVYALEYRKMRRYEAAMVRKFHHVIAVSENDRALMMKWTDASRITVVPTGVDLQRFSPGDPARRLDGLVLFVGAMDWEPNVDAVEYFCGRVWPAICAEYPGARFRIVGRNPGRRVRSLASDSVEVTGSVPSVQEHLEQASVVVVPLRIGGGTRLKIYEAMAMAKAVVSTTVGAEGLEVTSGRDIVLADGEPRLASAVVQLLRDRSERERYEQAAVALARSFDWSAIAEQFAAVLERIAGASDAVLSGVQAAGVWQGELKRPEGAA